MNSRQKRELIILIVVAVVALAAGMAYRTLITPLPANDTKGAIGKPMKRPDIAARVNGKDITNDEVDVYYHSNLGLKSVKEENIPEEMRQAYRYEALEQIIEERMLVTGAAELGIEVTKEETEKLFLKKVMPNFKDKAELEASLKADLGITVEQLKERLARQELADRVKAKLTKGMKVTDAEVSAEVKSLEKILSSNSHPGGKVEMPSKADIRKQLLEKKIDQAYADWLESLTAKTNVEILDPTLKNKPEAKKEESAPAGMGGEAEAPK
jgi:hypothetical protein